MSAVSLPPGLHPGGRFDQWQPGDIAWIASDVDGTILGSDDEVVASAARALQDAVDDGIAVGLVTGRSRDGVGRIADTMRLPGPHVSFNGAEVIHGDRTVAVWHLHDDHVTAVLDLCEDHAAYGEFYSVDQYWVTRTDERGQVHWASLGTDPVGLITTRVRPDVPLVKATLMGFDDQETARLHAALDALGLPVGDGRSIAHPGWSFLNVTSPGVDKARALHAGADHLGITMDRVMMIGDGHNDMPALAVAGTAVAMGNASPDVVRAAHLVTAGVDDDGLATALRALDLGAR